MRSPVLLLLIVPALASLCACSDSTGPAVDPSVALDLDETVGDFEGEAVVRIETKAVNNSRVPVEHYAVGVPITLWDSNGEQVYLRDPLLLPVKPRDIAPPHPVTLEPRESVESAYDLVWAYDPGGTRDRIPPGTYTVRAHFSYWWEGHPDFKNLELETVVVLE